MLKYQTVLRLAMAIAASIWTIGIFTTHFGWTFFSFFFAGITAWIMFQIGSKISAFILQKVFYKNDYHALLVDSMEAMDAIDEDLKPKVEDPVEEFAVIKTDEHQIGTFQDAPFYEWIDIEGKDGATHRAIYFGTMDISKGFTQKIPPDCVMIPPGILYQVQG